MNSRVRKSIFVMGSAIYMKICLPEVSVKPQNHFMELIGNHIIAFYSTLVILSD